MEPGVSPGRLGKGLPLEKRDAEKRRREH